MLTNSPVGNGIDLDVEEVASDPSGMAAGEHAGEDIWVLDEDDQRCTSPMDIIDRSDEPDNNTSQDASQSKLQCLQPGHQLDDSVIYPVFQMLATIRPGIIFAVDPLITATILADHAVPRRIAEQLGHFGRDATLLLPTHVNTNHWVLISVVGRNKSISIYDSLPAQIQPASLINNIEKLFRALLPRESVEEWNLVTRGGLRQTNGVDCGVAVITSALYIVAGVLPPDRVDWDSCRLVAARLLAHHNGGVIADALLMRRLAAMDDEKARVFDDMPGLPAMELRGLDGQNRCGQTFASVDETLAIVEAFKSRLAGWKEDHVAQFSAKQKDQIWMIRDLSMTIVLLAKMANDAYKAREINAEVEHGGGLDRAREALEATLADLGALVRRLEGLMA